MKQVYIPYYEWEDWKIGMWNKLAKDKEPEMLIKAINFTGNHIKYGEAMAKVIISWPRTMLNSLSNVSINRKAFLGHCACTYEFGCPEYITRMAWRELNNNQRYEADKVAQLNINKWVYEYKKSNRGIHKTMGRQMLFEWNT